MLLPSTVPEEPHQFEARHGPEGPYYKSHRLKILGFVLATCWLVLYVALQK